MQWYFTEMDVLHYVWIKQIIIKLLVVIISLTVLCISTNIHISFKILARWYYCICTYIHIYWFQRELIIWLLGTIDNPEEKRNADAARSLLIITLSPYSSENYTQFQDKVRVFNEEPPFNFFNPFSSYQKVVNIV